MWPASAMPGRREYGAPVLDARRSPEPRMPHMRVPLNRRYTVEASEARPETSLKSDPANKEFWSKCRQETSEIMNAHPKMQGGLRVRAHNASLPAPRGGHPRP